MKKNLLLGAVALLSANISAQTLTISFEDITALPAGCQFISRSEPAGSLSWSQGYPGGSLNTNASFGAYTANATTGDTMAYLGNSFQAADAQGVGGATISEWFLLPSLPVNNGDTLSFWTRTAAFGGTTVYPDRLQVRAAVGATTNVGTGATDIGDFSLLLLDINDQYTTTDYPLTWTKYEQVLSGLPGTNVTVSAAFRYFVEDGGSVGANSGVIAIDELLYKPNAAVGITNIAKPIAISAFPSPATSEVTVDFGQALTETSICSLINSNGQVVGTTQFQAGASAHRLNVSNLATGVYIVRLVQGSEVFQTTFVKQ